MQKKTLPDYHIGVKRPVFTDTYLQSLNKENIQILTSGIKKLTKNGILTKDGVEIEADVLIYATGFDCFKSILPFGVKGKRGVTLEQVWGKSPKAYKGICVPEMPNFFVMFGPNTINNRVFMSECAANFVSDSILKLSLSNRSSIEVRKDKYDEYNKALRAGLKKRTFGVTSGGFYANAEGENWQLYPHSILYYNWTTSAAQEEEFIWN